MWRWVVRSERLLTRGEALDTTILSAPPLRRVLCSGRDHVLSWMVYCMLSTREKMKHPGCQLPRIAKLRCVLVCVWQALPSPVLLVVSRKVRNSTVCCHGDEKATGTTRTCHFSLWVLYLWHKQMCVHS